MVSVVRTATAPHYNTFILNVGAYYSNSSTSRVRASFTHWVGGWVNITADVNNLRYIQIPLH